jgi:hypothetical protein
MTATLQLGNAAQTGTQAVRTAGAVATIGAQSGWWLSASAVPVIGAAVAGVTLGLQLLFNRKGPKQKRITTEIVNELEPLLRHNLEAYLSGPRTRASQAAALKNFDDAWAWLASAEACGNPDLGNPGKACIADRSRGGKWDWFSYYRDPIANDPEVEEDSAQWLQTGETALPLLPLGLLVLALLL